MDNLLSREQFEFNIDYLLLPKGDILGDEARNLIREAYAAALTEIEQLREAQRWIPVSERLPEETGMYLVFDDERVIGTFYREEGKRWYESGGYREQLHPTHWQPLPAPPTDKEKTS